MWPNDTAASERQLLSLGEAAAVVVVVAAGCSADPLAEELLKLQIIGNILCTFWQLFLVRLRKCILFRQQRPLIGWFALRISAIWALIQAIPGMVDLESQGFQINQLLKSMAKKKKKKVSAGKSKWISLWGLISKSELELQELILRSGSAVLEPTEMFL